MIDSVLRHCVDNKKRELSKLSNVGHQIVHVKLLALPGAHRILYVSRLRVNTGSLVLCSYIYACISHTLQVFTTVISFSNIIIRIPCSV